jgi:quercetin dioxygenase-like cupin family protein/DNA-binding XRE family transcriptional regulator
MTDPSASRIGSAVRERRLAAGWTLVQLAERVGLSQPFLSQIENDRARPSMSSLWRIAHELGTTPQALFSGGIDGSTVPRVVTAADDTAAVRSATGEGTGATDGSSAAGCRVLLPADAPFHVLEFVGLPTTFEDTWDHDGFESVYVVSGVADIEIDGEVTTMGPGDFVSYPARLPHRLRSTDPTVRVLMVGSTATAPDVHRR